MHDRATKGQTGILLFELIKVNERFNMSHKQAENVDRGIINKNGNQATTTQKNAANRPPRLSRKKCSICRKTYLSERIKKTQSSDGSMLYGL